MATKDHCLLFNNKKHETFGVNANGQYSNLNLNNQNKQCLSKNTVSSSKCVVINESRKAVTNNLQKKKSDQFWDQIITELPSNGYEHAFEKRKELGHQEKENSNKSSTLSLHIKAYENSIENISGHFKNGNESDAIKQIKGEKEAIKKWKNSKAFFSDSSSAVKAVFEHPRQQEQPDNNDPEVMQFKASQKLFNPNQPPSSKNGQQNSGLILQPSQQHSHFQKISDPPKKMSMERLLKHIDNTLIGLDSQIQDLSNIFDTFLSTKTGKSCLIVGQELCGKTSLIEAVYKKFPRDFEEENIVNIDGNFCDDSEGTNLIGIETKDAKLVIVDNFEQFAVRSRQQLLYTIMNQACSSNCLVLFCSRDANCTDAFEKRVRSRFSQKKIFLDPEEQSPTERLYQLLIPSSWKFKEIKESHEQWKKFCNDICFNNKFFGREIERVVSYGYGPSIYKLKQIALLLAAKYFDELPDDIEKAVTDITAMITPPRSTEILEYITTLETQEIFILEIMRRLTERNGIREIPYLNIFQSFSNVYHSLKAKPPRKETVYFMLERMVDKKVIEMKEGTHKGQLDFRPVHVTVSSDTIKAAWEKRSKKTFLADAFLATMNLQL